MTRDAAVARARAMRKALTPPEARLWVALRHLRSDGFHFRRQAPFRAYVLDFVCHAQRLAVEVDGVQHTEPEQSRHDTVRDAVLTREGYRTLRFAGAEVLGDLDGVVTAIRAALEGGQTGAVCASASPPPGASRHPPHQGEGEGMV